MIIQFGQLTNPIEVFVGTGEDLEFWNIFCI